MIATLITSTLATLVRALKYAVTLRLTAEMRDDAARYYREHNMAPGIDVQGS